MKKCVTQSSSSKGFGSYQRDGKSCLVSDTDSRVKFSLLILCVNFTCVAISISPHLVHSCEIPTGWFQFHVFFLNFLSYAQLVTLQAYVVRRTQSTYKCRTGRNAYPTSRSCVDSTSRQPVWLTLIRPPSSKSKHCRRLQLSRWVASR